jgi:predicted ATPase/DNA-binding CsgD family transcriptional regulator
VRHTLPRVARHRVGTAPAGHRLQLPPQLTPFIDRQRELGQLRPLLLEQRLLSLVGPAGIGKTRLALELAASVAKRFAGGWFVELAPLREPEMLPRLVARSVGIEEESADAFQQLLEALSETRALLVLDNCESMEAASALLVDGLLRGCPHLTILVTSRVRLGVDGELVWRVAPLDTPQPGRPYTPHQLTRLDSAQLFVDRAWRSHPDFAITDANASDVAELLRRLEGLPLAIELAATWSSTLTPLEIVSRLDDRFQLLTARNHTMNPRHASLRAAIDSSYDALEEVERAVFRQLGLFAGGWSLRTMSSVCALEPEPALRVLVNLVDRSLVSGSGHPDGTTRYRMLDVLREYATDKLRESGELESAWGRFTTSFLRMAQSAAGRLTAAGGERRLRELGTEHANFRAILATGAPSDPAQALRLASALTDYWRLCGHYTEARRHLRAAIRRAPAYTPELIGALQSLGMLAFLQGDQPEAMRWTRRALAISERTGDRRGSLRAGEQLARIQFASGSLASARACLDRGMGAANLLGDPEILCTYQLLLGQFALAEGRADDGVERLARALDLARQADHVELSAVASGLLGRLHLLRGRPDLARPLLFDTLTSIRRFGSWRHVAPVLESLAAVAADEGQHERAAQLAGAAAGLHDQVGARPPAASPVRAPLAGRWARAVATGPGRRAFEKGRSMDLDQAVRYALDEAELPTPPADSALRTSTPLTRRQLQIARLVAHGHTNREIADRLFISERTAEGHVEQIRNKLGFSSRVQIAAWLVEQQQTGDEGG